MSLKDALVLMDLQDDLRDYLIYLSWIFSYLQKNIYGLESIGLWFFVKSFIHYK